MGRIFAGVCIAATCGAAVWTAFSYVRDASSADAEEYVSNGKVDFRSASQHWLFVLHEQGPSRAREEFVRAASELSASQAHVLAHAFGESLFQAIGVSGFDQCDTSFVYGCFHQFIGNAIASLGTPVIHELAARCRNMSPRDHFPCMHGVGHGILGSFGYSLDDLVKGLDLCREIDFTRDSRACSDGMFMEYNLHELAAKDTGSIVAPRPFTESAAYAPCETVRSEDRMTCYFELPNWWVTAQDNSVATVARFTYAGSLCSRIANKEYTLSCFQGLGHIAPPLSSLSIEGTRSLCEASTRNALYQLHCVSAASHRFEIEHAADAAQICSQFGLAGRELAYCVDFVTRDDK